MMMMMIEDDGDGSDDDDNWVLSVSLGFVMCKNHCKYFSTLTGFEPTTKRPMTNGRHTITCPMMQQIRKCLTAIIM